MPELLLEAPPHAASPKHIADRHTAATVAIIFLLKLKFLMPASFLQETHWKL